jgi:hypothetical protein
MKKKDSIKYLKFILIFIVLSLVLNSTSALIIDSVFITPDEVSPGDTTRIVLSLKNDADVDIEDVFINLDLNNLPLAPYKSGADYSFNEIREGKTKSAEFEIVAYDDAKSGIYKIPVKIGYNEEGETKTRDSVISLKINSKPVIEAGVDEGLILKGQENTLSVKIINKGVSDAKFLEIELGTSSCCTTLSQRNVYIGDVDSNDFQSAEFKLFVKSNSQSSIDIPIKVSYKDFSNQEYSDDLTLSVRAYSREEANKLGLLPKNNTIYIVIIIIVLIIAFFVYRAIRKRRRKQT